jgi:hypothetical protein
MVDVLLTMNEAPCYAESQSFPAAFLALAGKLRAGDLIEKKHD